MMRLTLLQQLTIIKKNSSYWVKKKRLFLYEQLSNSTNYLLKLQNISLIISLPQVIQITPRVVFNNQ